MTVHTRYIAGWVSQITRQHKSVELLYCSCLRPSKFNSAILWVHLFSKSKKRNRNCQVKVFWFVLFLWTIYEYILAYWLSSPNGGTSRFTSLKKCWSLFRMYNITLVEFQNIIYKSFNVYNTNCMCTKEHRKNLMRRNQPDVRVHPNHGGNARLVPYPMQNVTGLNKVNG